jgi:hypothetical protein
MTGTAIPAAIDALVALFAAALPTFEVSDGQPRDPGPLVLCVGWDGLDQPSASGSVTVGNYGIGGQQLEAFDVSNLLSTWSGSATASQERAVIFEAFAAVKAAVSTNPSLSDAVASARITDFDYMTSNRVEGIPERVRFTIHIEAWR